MREVKIIVNEDAEIVSVNDFFTFSVKYHNLSSTADTIPESEKLIVRWSTTGIWLIGDDELLIEEDGNWRDVSKELSFFLEWQNPDSIHSPISLKMLFYAIVDSLKHDSWKTFGSYQEHSIRISEIAQHYSEKVIQKEQDSIQKQLNKVIFEDLKRDFINHVKKELRPTSEERMKRGFEAMDRLDALRVPVSKSVPDPRLVSMYRHENEKKCLIKTSTGTIVDKSLIVRKKWIEITEEEMSIIIPIITPMFKSMSKEEIQKYWDDIEPYDRLLIIT